MLSTQGYNHSPYSREQFHMLLLVDSGLSYELSYEYLPL